MFQATVNNEKKIEITQTENSILLNGEMVTWDLIKLEGNKHHIIWNNKSYLVELVRKTPESKSYSFLINGKKFSVDLQDDSDLLLARLGINKNTDQLQKEIKAPMPGLLLEVLVKEGQEVQKGDPLLILEAMKMENVLKSPRGGVVKTIKISKGGSVEKNQILIQF